MVFTDGTPVVCEGQYGPFQRDNWPDNGLTDPVHAKTDVVNGSCFAYNMSSNTWTFRSYTPYRRHGVAFDFNPKVGIIMAGGKTHVQSNIGYHCRADGRAGTTFPVKSPCGDVDAVTISRDYGLTWKNLAPLPVKDYNGILRFSDDKTVFYFPRSSGMVDKPFYILDLENNVWNEGPRLKYPRRDHFVGIVTRASGEKEVVFAGGVIYPSKSPNGLPADTESCRQTCSGWTFTKSVEIYNIANKTMREGKYALTIQKFKMVNHYLPLVTNNNNINNGGGGSSHLYQLLTSGAGDCKKNGDASAIKQGRNSIDIFPS